MRGESGSQPPVYDPCPWFPLLRAAWLVQPQEREGTARIRNYSSLEALGEGIPFNPCGVRWLQGEGIGIAPSDSKATKILISYKGTDVLMKGKLTQHVFSLETNQEREQ